MAVSVVSAARVVALKMEGSESGALMVGGQAGLFLLMFDRGRDHVLIPVWSLRICN